MKKQHSLLVFILALMGFMLFVNANNITKGHDRHDGFDIQTFTVTLDSMDVESTDAFMLGKYLHSNWTSFPFRYSVNVTSDDMDTLSLAAHLYGSMTGTGAWQLVDTLWTLTETGTFSGDTTIYGTIDFNNSKWPYYQIREKSLVDTTADFAVIYKIMAYQE